MAFGIGTSEVEHVLATQTLPLKPFKTMAITVEGELRPGVTAKDIILAVIAKIGTGGGQGYVLEYRGSAIRALSMEGRMTICNMSIEAGARAGMVAPDETTFEYLKGRAARPAGRRTGTTPSPTGRRCRPTRAPSFDAEVFLDANELEPFVTWGTNPGQGVSLSDVVPDPADFADPNERAAAERALEYMDLAAGTPLKDIAVDAVFMGSCTNSRIEDLRAFASIVKGQKKADGVRVMVVPGLGPRAPRGRGRGPRQGLHGLRRRVALRRLLDVPRHEPRPARAGGALRVDLEPQLRGPAGQGRAHPPGVAARRRGHRGPRHAVEPVGSASADCAKVEA